MLMRHPKKKWIVEFIQSATSQVKPLSTAEQALMVEARPRHIGRPHPVTVSNIKRVVYEEKFPVNSFSGENIKSVGASGIVFRDIPESIHS